MDRTRTLLIPLLALAAGACDKPARPPKAQRPQNVAKRLAKAPAPELPAPLTGLVFAPQPSRPEVQEPPGYMLDYCQPPAGGRDRRPVPLGGPFPPAARTTVVYQDTATLLQPPFRCVITDEDDWTEIQVLGRMTVDKTLIIDFRREMVLLAGTGARQSSGYAVRFDSVVIRRDTLWAFVGNLAPAPGAVLGAEPFSAVDVRRLPRFGGPVVFVEEPIPPPLQQPSIGAMAKDSVRAAKHRRRRH
jgi:hypothetical protein